MSIKFEGRGRASSIGPACALELAIGNGLKWFFTGAVPGRSFQPPGTISDSLFFALLFSAIRAQVSGLEFRCLLGLLSFGLRSRLAQYPMLSAQS